jgi:cytochrome b
VERGLGKIPVSAMMMMMIIIIIRFPSQQCLADSQKSTGLADQALRIHCSARNLLTALNVLNITAVFIRIYRQRRRLSSFRLSSNSFGVIPVVDITIGTNIIIIIIIAAGIA